MFRILEQTVQVTQFWFSFIFAAVAFEATVDSVGKIPLFSQKMMVQIPKYLLDQAMENANVHMAWHP